MISEYLLQGGLINCSKAMGAKWQLLLVVPINLLNLLLLLTIPLNLASSPAEKSMDPGLQEEYCRNFTVGNTENHIFFSPRYPLNYPAGIKCFRYHE